MRYNELLSLLNEGGNLSLPGGHQAQTIDLKVHDRSYIVPILNNLLAAIDQAYMKKYKEHLWQPELLASKKFLSGSSLHFFDTKISDEQFVKLKPKVGDIDTQVDRNKAKNLEQLLVALQNKTVGPAKFLGFERGNEQFSALWELSNPPIKVQIDFEFVEYKGIEPTSWSQFSHSSAWDDIQVGVKGVFHKYIIQSFASLTKQDFLLRKMVGRGKAKQEQDVPTSDNMFSFAVSSKEGGGLRQKYEPVLDNNGQPLVKDGLPVMTARPTSGYEQDIVKIFSNLFGKKISASDMKNIESKFWSFKGLLDVMKTYLPAEDQQIVIDNFIKKVFDKGAQGLYKNDPERDASEKLAALNLMFSTLQIPAPAYLEKMIADYKAGYRMTEGLYEADPIDYSRQGIKHIYNPGSSTEMRDKEFLEFVNEIQKNRATLDNIPVNLKVDGAGIRFGKDSNGRPFLMTSRVNKPLYSDNIGDFEKYGQSVGQTPEQLARTRNYDKALSLIVNSSFVKELPNDTIVQAEMLFNDMAEKTDKGLKFVNISYDPSKLGSQMTLVPFEFKKFSTGETLTDSEKIKKQLLSKSSKDIKIIDNRLSQKGIDLSKIINPVVTMSNEMRTALLSKKASPEKQQAKEIVASVRKNLSNIIANSDKIQGKDQLGSTIEGLVLNMPNGMLAKVTSQEMKDAMAAKKTLAPKSATASNRTRTAVVTAGSFVGHKGHQQLVDLVISAAKQVGGDPYVYISSKVGPDDPIPPQVKLATWKKLYPEYPNMFQLIVSPDGVTTPSPVKKIEKELVLPANSPYKKIILMVGADRYEGFKKWMDTLEKRMKDPAALAKFGGTQDQVEFETIRTGRAAEEGGTGISFSQLRNILKNPNATDEQKLALWSKGFDVSKLGQDHIKQLIKVSQQNMGIQEARRGKSKKKKASASGVYYGYYWGGSSEGSDSGVSESINIKNRKERNMKNKNVYEVANNPYRFLLAKRSKEGASYIFQTDNNSRYHVMIEKQPMINGGTKATIGFADVTEKNNPTIDLTAKGDSFRVFATIQAIVKDYLKTNQPEILRFYGKSKEPSRIKLYDKIAQKLGNYLPNYKFDNQMIVNDEKMYTFSLVKNENVRETVELDEVSMSPAALADFSKTELAQNITAGFEAELVVPNAASDEDGELEPDYDEDISVTNTESIRRFFLGGDMGPSRREIDRVIQLIDEEFYEWADDRIAEEWKVDKDALIREKMKEDELTDEEISDSMETEDRTYKQYYDTALEEFRENYDYDQHWDDFIEEEYSTMIDVHRSHDLDWPYWTNSAGEGRDIDTVALEIEDYIGMKVKGSSSYHSAKRGSDFFILEPDSSIDSEEGDAGLELVSPPMPLMQCLSYLDKVFDWAKNEGCETNQSTGFHMGVSIPKQTMDNVDHLKFILFLGDEYVLNQFSRQNNSYAKSMVKQMSSQLKQMQSSGANIQEILNTFKSGMNSAAAKAMGRLITSTSDRYVTVNIKSNYIEVRSAGGDYLGDLDKIKNTLLRYVRVMALAADPEAEKQEYAKKLYKFLGPLIPNDLDVINYFAQYSAGTLPAGVLKSFIRNIQQKRAEKKNPTVAATSGGTIPYDVLRVRDGFKVHQFLARDRRHATELKNIWAINNRVNASDYTVSLMSSAPPAQDEAETYVIIYGDPTGQEHQTAIDANSSQEAIDWFRSNHPSTYTILDIN